jgi:hypothetical protein
MFRNAIEQLEPRTLFNTIINDGTGSGTFEYKDGLNNIVRVTYHNVVAELVFARVDKATNNVVLGDATPSFAEEDGKDLFTIYVASAGADSFITIAGVPAVTANVRPMQPFSGSVSLNIFGRGGLQTISTAGTSGDVYLGARTKDTPANINLEVNRPILTDQFFGLGILGPRPNGRLTAGLIVENGVDLGKFFFGGAISGQVTIGGSMDTFYCGALLTGDTRGDNFFQPTIPNNFFVAGDLHELIVKGSIGTHAPQTDGDLIYRTGFDAQINGTLGRVQAYDNIAGDIRALNDPNAPRLRSSINEVETKVRPRNRGDATHFEGTDTDDLAIFDPEFVGQPRLGDNQGDFNNDTFQTPQLLGVIDSKTLGQNVISVNGKLQNIPQISDGLDFYGVGLLAGQTITIRIVDEGDAFLSPITSLQVYDPDNRVVASDASNPNIDPGAGRTFQFTADRPGTYRFAVNATRGGVTTISNIDYNLKILNVGETTIGAISAGGEIFGEGGTIHFQAARGDIGVVTAGTNLAFDVNGTAHIFVDGGNLRSVDAAQLALAINTSGFQEPSFAVTGGSIGLIRARTSFANVDTITIKDGPGRVGGDLQLIEAPTNSLHFELFADGAMGIARARDMATPFASAINVNFDNAGGDGVIDLIDVDGDFGTLGEGGPGITTGDGGNVRYIHVGGQAFRDRFFGGGAPDIANFAVGEAVNFVDDSGTVMKFTPTAGRQIVNPDGTISILNGGALSTVRYGIRDKGGTVLINLGSTRGVTVAAGGQNPRGTAEIGTITAQGIGTAIVNDTRQTLTNELDDVLELDTTGTTGANPVNQALDVIMQGNAMIDVFEITQGGGSGNFTKIINETGGEIVNLTAASVGQLVAGTLGLSRSSTGTKVEGNRVVALPITPVGPADAGPFNGQRNIIRVNGDLLSARTLYGMGNFAVYGTIQELIANADGKPAKAVHEGINGPIMTQPGGAAPGGGGGMVTVNIGEGILPSGTGAVINSGLFAHGRIGLVVNQGLGSDIRGTIISKGQNLPTITRVAANGVTEVTSAPPIDTIALTDGAILGATIAVRDTFDGSGTGVINIGNTTTDPVFEIETIHLVGRGGIMGASIGAADVGDIVIEGGFGILSTAIGSVAEGTLNSIITDGYGIRTSAFVGGGSVRLINARGNGTKLSTTSYTPSVRFSENLSFDPYTGQPFTALNDLHAFLGTTAANPVRTTGSTSTSGLIRDFLGTGARDLNQLIANRIEASNFTFASSTNQVIVRDYIDFANFISGRLNFMQTGTDVFNTLISIAGPVGTVGIGGTFRGTSRLAATGPNGQIGTFATGRALFGSVTSSNNASLIRVGTDFGAPGAFNADGDRISAGVDVGRNLSQFIIKGSMLDGSTGFVGDDLGFLQVGGDIQDGALLSVESLSSQDIGGQVFGEVEIRG